MEILKVISEMVLHVLDPDVFSAADPLMMAVVAYTVGISIISMFWRLYHGFLNLR